MGEHRVAAVALERVAVHEGLGHRLDGEGLVGVADRIDLAVDGRERDAEGGRIGLAELGDVVGGLSPGQAGDPLMQLDEIILHGRERAAHPCLSQESQRRLVHQRSKQGRNIAATVSFAGRYPRAKAI